MSREKGLEILDRMLGEERAQATRETWLQMSPGFEKLVVEFLAGEVWTRGGLDLRTRSLCTVAMLAALGRSRGLELNIRMALNNGATKEEILETLLQVGPYAGFPAAWEAITIADGVFKSQ